MFRGFEMFYPPQNYFWKKVVLFEVGVMIDFTKKGSVPVNFGGSLIAQWSHPYIGFEYMSSAQSQIIYMQNANNYVQQ